MLKHSLRIIGFLPIIIFLSCSPKVSTTNAKTNSTTNSENEASKSTSEKNEKPSNNLKIQQSQLKEFPKKPKVKDPNSIPPEKAPENRNK